MSLKVFHIVFISICVLFSLFVGVWGLSQQHFALGVVFFALGAALVVYGATAFHKLKEIH